MLTTRFALPAVFAIALAIHLCDASGQNYPSKTIRIVTVTGSSAVLSRFVAQGIAGPLGQQVIVDNRPSGVVPGDLVAKSPPDGYTLLVYGPPLWIGPLMQSTPYDPVRDFSPITLATSEPLLVVVHPALPVKSIRDLIALAKSRPGQLDYASSSVGGASQLAMELFKSMAGGLNIVRVSYSNNEMKTADMLSGRVPLTIIAPASVVPFVKAGRLRALAVTSAERSAILPEYPTVAASGVPGYEAAIATGVFAPAKTPQPIIDRLNQDIVRYLKAPETREKFLSAGIEPVGSSPGEFAAKIKAEIARMGKVIKENGIRAE